MRVCSPVSVSLLGCVCVFGLSASVAHGADAASAWREILALDAGPKREGLKDAASTDVYLQHLLLQEGALRKFIDLPDSGDKKFEAEFRLARVLGIRAELEMNDEMHAQAQAHQASPAPARAVCRSSQARLGAQALERGETRLRIFYHQSQVNR